MTWTGAQLVVKALEAQGVERVFGLPGVQNLELYDALKDAAFEAVLVTHELCAAFMADAYSRSTGKVGCSVLVPGPGLTNASTGLAESFLDSVPQVVIVPGPRNDIEKGFQLHQVRQLDAIRPLVKAALHAERVEDVFPLVSEAFALARGGEPGPAVVEIPYNLFQEKATIPPPAPAASKLAQIQSGLAPEEKRLKEIARAIEQAKQVGIYAGFGATDARALLVRLAELLQAPVATTIAGRGVIPEDHPLSVGFGFGPAGSPLAEEVFGGCDLVLALACKFGEVATGAYGIKPPRNLIHVDINPDVLGRNLPASLTLQGDARDVLEGLLEELSRNPRPVNRPLQERIARERQRYFRTIEQSPEQSDGVNPARLLWELRKLLARDAILTTDSGAHQFWVVSCFPIFAARSYLTPTDYQSMGYSIPAMVSAKMAFPSRQVIGVVGDGGFLMTGSEIVTALRYKLNPVVLLFNDGELGLIREAQDRIYGRTSCIELLNPDYELLARAYGANYFCIQSDPEISAILRQALASDRLAIVDARVRYREHTRYFRGAAAASMSRMPLGLKLRLAARRIHRMFRM